MANRVNWVADGSDGVSVRSGYTVKITAGTAVSTQTVKKHGIVAVDEGHAIQVFIGERVWIGTRATYWY